MWVGHHCCTLVNVRTFVTRVLTIWLRILLFTKNFPFPVFENDLYAYLWEWIDDDWSLELEYQKSKVHDGWVYFDSNWEMEESETDSVDTLVLESGLEEPH